MTGEGGQVYPITAQVFKGGGGGERVPLSLEGKQGERRKGEGKVRKIECVSEEFL